MRSLFLILSLLITLPGDASSQDGYVPGTSKIAYWKAGADSATLIVLHGGPGAAHNYLRPEWDYLNKASTVFYYDQRGCGKSERSNCYSWQQHVDDLKRLIKTIKPGGKVILAGSSWGTILALLYAYTYPDDVKGIILSGTVAWPGKSAMVSDCSHQARAGKQHLSSGDTLIGYRCLRKELFINYSGKMTSPLQELIDTHKCHEINVVSNAATSKSLLSAPTLSKLKSLKMPVLIFQSLGECNLGTRTYLKDAAHQFKGILPNLEICRISNACHDPWMTHTEVFFQRSIAFIMR
jgi:proline iminopeptidase